MYRCGKFGAKACLCWNIQAAQYGIGKLELHNCLICMSVKEVHMADLFADFLGEIIEGSTS